MYYLIQNTCERLSDQTYEKEHFFQIKSDSFCCYFVWIWSVRRLFNWQMHDSHIPQTPYVCLHAKTCRHALLADALHASNGPTGKRKKCVILRPFSNQRSLFCTADDPRFLLGISSWKSPTYDKTTDKKVWPRKTLFSKQNVWMCV